MELFITSINISHVTVFQKRDYNLHWRSKKFEDKKNPVLTFTSRLYNKLHNERRTYFKTDKIPMIIIKIKVTYKMQP